jgi:hypothetical protein
MWNTVVRCGSSTDAQRYEYGVRRIYHQKPLERHGLLRTDTVWYETTRIRTDALRIHYHLLRYKHGLVRISTVWYGVERIDTEKNELLRIYTDLLFPSTTSCMLISKCLTRKEHLENELQSSMILAERIRSHRVRPLDISGPIKVNFLKYTGSSYKTWRGLRNHHVVVFSYLVRYGLVIINEKCWSILLLL